MRRSVWRQRKAGIWRTELDVAGCVGQAGTVLGGVDVGEDGEAGVFGYGAENACAFGEAGTAKGTDAGAIGFVVRGFKNVGEFKVGG